MSSTPSIAARALPYLTADLPGTGGVIKSTNDDFVVEELPRYPASGAGTHVYMLVEKQGMTTLQAIQRLARALGRAPRDIGYAGMKDAHGITRQWLSIEHVETARVQALAEPGMRLLSVTRHTNKIKLGHLSGNRFTIRVRQHDAGSLPKAQAIVETLRTRGVPNFFGPQRFGARGDNAMIGLAAVRGDFVEALAWMLGRPGPFDHGGVQRARELFDAGDHQAAADAWPGAFRSAAKICRALARTGDPRRAWREVDHTLRKLFVSALQSELFNRLLVRRLPEFDVIHDGDLAYKHANGACFLVENAGAEQPRCAAFEISPTGPLFGRRMTEPRGKPAEWEQAVLQDSGLNRDEIAAEEGSRLDGARRPLRVPVGDLSVEEGQDHRGPYLALTFALPAGAYATSVVREVCKNDDDRRQGGMGDVDEED